MGFRIKSGLAHIHWNLGFPKLESLSSMAFSTSPSKIPSFLKSNESKCPVFQPKQLKMNVKKESSVGCIKASQLLGIDLGTTNTVAAIAHRQRKIIVVPNSDGNNITPSVVAYTNDGNILVGDAAKQHGFQNPENTISNVKRFIGRKMSELDEQSKQVSFEVSSHYKGNVRLSCPSLGRWMFKTPEQVSAQILRKIVEDAAKYLKHQVTGVIIAIPAHFNDSQKEATREAVHMAGLRCLRTVYEPVAAVMGYGFDRRNSDVLTLVFDLGGGTFDVSVIESGDGILEVLSMGGDPHLGGADFDKRIVDWLASNFQREGGIDLLKDKVALQLLTMAAEKAKMELSYMARAEIKIRGLSGRGGKDFNAVLTRSKFEELCWDLFERLEAPVHKALRDANLTFQDLNEVILAGGSTRMPAVKELVKKITGMVPNALPNPDEVVALGAAHVGNNICGGEVGGVVVSNVTPYSISLETCGDVTRKMIARNTRLPASASAIISTTVADGQSSVDITILREEEERSLGKFRLGGILRSPSGVAQIEVKLDIDAKGILSAAAVDKGTGNKEDISIAIWPVDDEVGADCNV